jgi:nudix-type nucleoside diphosphatase (YffH/AdpP family)
MKVEIHHQEVLFKGFFTLHRAELSFEKFDGHMSGPVMRLAIERGDAVAVLTYDSKRKKIVFVRQFRFPMYLVEAQNAWILEAVAGTMDDDGQPELTAVREVEEEIGYVIHRKNLQYITTCSPSPGGLTERIHLYLADLSQATAKNKGGGLEEEAEDIQVVELDYDEAFSLVQKGEISDAKTVICLLWLKLMAG